MATRYKIISDKDKAAAADMTTGTDDAKYLTASALTNSRPTFAQGVKLGTAPTVGAYAKGKLYYDIDWETVAVNIGRDVVLQVGEEEIRRVYNATGAILL